MRARLARRAPRSCSDRPGPASTLTPVAPSAAHPWVRSWSPFGKRSAKGAILHCTGVPATGIIRDPCVGIVDEFRQPKKNLAEVETSPHLLLYASCTARELSRGGQTLFMTRTDVVANTCTAPPSGGGTAWSARAYSLGAVPVTRPARSEGSGVLDERPVCPWATQPAGSDLQNADGSKAAQGIRSSGVLLLGRRSLFFIDGLITERRTL
jgi:hypothetical protein